MNNRKKIEYINCMVCTLLILHMYRDLPLEREAQDLLYSVSYPSRTADRSRTHKGLDRSGMPVL